MSELSEKDFDQIERTILGKLSPKEQSDFEAELKANPEFRQAYSEQKRLMNAVEAEGLRAELESIHTELYRAVAKKGNQPLFLAMAASIAVLIGFSLWYFGQTNGASDLYAQYSYTDPGLPVPMSATDSYDFYDAMVDYKTENYSQAIKKWEMLLESEPQNDTLNYYLGAAYFNLESFDEAVPFLKETAEKEGSFFKFKAEYLIFLSNLKRGKTEVVLNFEVTTGSPFEADIKAIQESLDS